MSLDDSPPYEPSARRVPGYPLFLAGFYRLKGEPNVRFAKLVQVFFVPVWCLLVFVTGRRIFGGVGPALIAATLVAVLPVMLQASNRLLTEGLFTAVLLTATYSAYRWIDGRSLAWAVGAGVCWGALALTKPEAALLPVAVVPIAVLSRGDWRRGVLEGLLACSIVAVMVGGWVYRNSWVVGKPCLISGSGDGSGQGTLRWYRLRAENGVTFWPMRYKYLYGERWREAEAAYQAAVNGDVRDPAESDVSFWLRRPALLVKYSAIRFAGLMKPTSWSETFRLTGDFGEYMQQGKYLQLGAKTGLLLLDVAVSVIGLIAFIFSLHPKHRRLWIVTATVAYFIVVYSLLHGIPRYRIPLVPFLVLLGAWWLSGLCSRWSQRGTETAIQSAQLAAAAG